MQLLLIILLAITSSLALTPVRYDGFQVYRVKAKTDQQLDVLKQLERNPQGFDFWSDVPAVGNTVDIMVPPHLKHKFSNLLHLQKLEAELWIKNVQERINIEKAGALKTSSVFDWKTYHTLDEINAWLDSLIEKYPQLTCIQGGQSYEGRKIRGVKLSFGPGKKGIFIEGGIHAREWISPATVTYILNEFLTSNNTAVKTLAESRDWYFFPSVNPDGFVYTYTTDRLWRKTRKPYGSCYGADPNRNWDYHWMDGGSTNDSCTNFYAGTEPFSEIEAKSLSEYIEGVVDTLDAYIAFHSYGQLLLIPYGHQGREKPENNEELLRIGKAAIEALTARHGTVYKVGNVPETINYIASGGSTDWVLGLHKKVRLVYTYELRDQGKYGFILPPDQILPTAEETLDSLVAMFQEADKL